MSERVIIQLSDTGPEAGTPSNPINVTMGTVVVSGTITSVIPVDIRQVSGASISLGQTSMAASFPVTIANNQSPISSFLGGTVSSGNTTTNPLSVSTTFTGVFEDQVNLGGVSVAVSSNVNGTLLIDNSDIGTDTSIVRTSTFSVTGGTPFFIGLTPLNRYIRTRYTNGATSQTSFNLQTVGRQVPINPTNLPINASIGSASLAINTRAVLAGQREDGVFQNVMLANSGSLEVAVTDRPSQVKSRTHVDANISNALLRATSTVIWSVTTGKVFHLVSLGLSMINASVLNGSVEIRDGTAIKLPYIMTSQAVGASAAQTVSPTTFAEPIPFTSTVNAVASAGTVTASIFIVGYEE